MLTIVARGTTSNVIRIFIKDSSVTTGAGKTGLGISSTGLIISTQCDNEGSPVNYTAAGSTIETISAIGTFAAPTTNKCRFKEVDSTNQPGMYELQFADARYAVSNAKLLYVTISGSASNIVTTPFVIVLTAVDFNNATNMNIGALPAVTVGNNGALPTANGSNQVGLDWGNVGNKTTVNNLSGTQISASQNVNTCRYSDWGTSANVSSATSGALTLTASLGGTNIYRGGTFTVSAGTGVGQTGGILSHTTTVITLDAPLQTQLDNTSVIEIRRNRVPALDTSLQVAANAVNGNVSGSVGSVLDDFITSGTAQAGGNNTITLAAGSFSGTVGNEPVGATIRISGGTGLYQTRRVIAYNSSTQVLTVSRNWITNPASGSVYRIYRDDGPATDSTLQIAANLTQILGTALTETVGGYLAAGLKKLLDVASPIFTLASFNQTGDSYARLGAPAGASIASDIASNLTAILNVQNGTFISANVPPVLERPDSGTEPVKIVVVICDETGAPKNIDGGANPTVILVNESGTDRSSRLGTWSTSTTGRYESTYTNSVSDAFERLNWELTATVNSKVRRFVTKMQIVDTTAVDFTSSDRTALNAIKTFTDASTAQTADVGQRIPGRLKATSDLDGSIWPWVKNDQGNNIPTAVQNRQEMDANSTKLESIESVVAVLVGGNGSFSVDVVVTDDADTRLQSVNVSAWLGNVEAAQLSTDADGAATLALDAGTYQLNVSLLGFNGSSQTITVPLSDPLPTIVLTQLSTTPSSPDRSTGYLYVDALDGSAGAGIPHYLSARKPAHGATGTSSTSQPREAVPNDSGYVQWDNLLPGMTYEVWRGDGRQRQSFVAGTGLFSIASLIGVDQ